MALDLERMRGYRPPASKQAIDIAADLIRRSTFPQHCLVCGGGGWVGPHDVGCPLDELRAFHSIQVLDQRCPDCAHHVLIFNGERPTKTACPRCQFYGQRSVLDASIDAVRRAKKVRKTKPKLSKRLKKEGARLLEIYRSATCQYVIGTDKQ